MRLNLSFSLWNYMCGYYYFNLRVFWMWTCFKVELKDKFNFKRSRWASSSLWSPNYTSFSKINELRPISFLLQTLIREETTWPLHMVRGYFYLIKRTVHIVNSIWVGKRFRTRMLWFIFHFKVCKDKIRISSFSQFVVHKEINLLVVDNNWIIHELSVEEDEEDSNVRINRPLVKNRVSIRGELLYDDYYRGSAIAFSFSWISHCRITHSRGQSSGKVNFGTGYFVQFREIDKTRAVDRDFDSISISSSAITNSDFQHFYNRIIC